MEDKKSSQRYLGLEAIIAALFYTLMAGTIEIGGLLIKTTYLIAIYLVLKFIYKIKGYFSIAIALGFLGLAAIFAVGDESSKANWAAQIAFIFLVIGILWQIAEMVTERRSKQIEALKTSFWERRDLVVAAIIVFLIFAYSYKINSKFYFFQENLIKMKQSNMELKTNLRMWEEKAFNRARVKVLSHDDMLVEASMVVSMLKNRGTGTIKIGDSVQKIQKQTVVRYKTSDPIIAYRIAKLLKPDYPIKTIPNLSDGSSFDAIVIMGYGKKPQL